MEQNEANARVTEQPTPAGQAITTDMVFDLFASLVPDSPWAKRLLKIKATFNHLATGAHMLTTIPDWNLGDQVYGVREREAQGWDGPNVTQFSKAVAELLNGLQQMRVDEVHVPESDPVDLSNAIGAEISALLKTVGAVISEPPNESSITFTDAQLALFLSEYRRQVSPGESS